MAMIYCSQCGKQISDLAPVCPQCGAPQQVAPQYQQPIQPIYVVQPVKPKIPGRGFSITSLVLGIIAIYFAVYYLIFWILMFTTDFFHTNILHSWSNVVIASILPFFFYSFVLGALALIFGIASHNRGCKLKKKTAGIVMGTISIAIALFLTIISLIVLS